MKRTYKLILAAIATGLVLTSCSDELITGENGNAQSEGSRVIAISFGPQTRTALDGLTPKFTGQNERIMISNESECHTCVVKVHKDGGTYVSTKLKGTLTAVYPASAAMMNGNAIEGVNVSSVQDGTFANANICMATIAADESTAQFKNQFALFVISPPEGTTKLTVKSLGQIEESSGQRTGYAYPITTGDGDAAFSVTATGKDADGKIYVSLCQGVKLSDLSFEAEFATTGTGSIKGIPMKAIEEAKAENTTVGGTIYTINGDNWHEYVTINGVKWATMNIGAESETDYGNYYMWGAIDLAYDNLSGTTFSFASKPDSYYNTTWNAAKGFGWANTQYTDGEYSDTNYGVFTKYTGSKNEYAKSGTADGKTRLDLADDVAYVNWGGSWRMPTGGDDGELPLLISATGTTAANISNGGLYINGTNLFFPAAGYGVNLSHDCAGDHGLYWTSTLSTTSHKSYALRLCPYIDREPHDRYHGFSVRAVVNESKVKNPFSGEVTVNSSGKKVRFTRGNLYWDGAALHIEDEQWKTLPTENGIGRDEGHVSHFHFCNTVAKATSMTYEKNDSKDDYLFCDENHKVTVDGLSKLYVLTIDEWWYLLDERTKAKGTASSVGSQTDARFMMCNLQYDEENSIYGTIIFPDVFTWPSSVSVPASNKFNTGLTKTNALTFTSADFTALESAGVVFIPAAGLRSENAKVIDNFNILANYWSSSISYYVKTFLFNYESGNYIDNNNNRHSASPIRLVKNVQ